MSDIAIAFALAMLGLLGIVVSFGFWSKHAPSRTPFPVSIRFAAIGGWLALAGALCFAVAAFLGG
jgi:hypothetical protein